MNERIRELTEQCYNLPDSPEALYYRKFDMEKFALLIVRKCCDVLYDNEMGGYRVDHVLKEYFGIEE